MLMYLIVLHSILYATFNKSLEIHIMLYLIIGFSTHLFVQDPLRKEILEVEPLDKNKTSDF